MKRFHLPKNLLRILGFVFFLLAGYFWPAILLVFFTYTGIVNHCDVSYIVFLPFYFLALYYSDLYAKKAVYYYKIRNIKNGNPSVLLLCIYWFSLWLTLKTSPCDLFN